MSAISQAAFAAALLDAERPLPPGVSTHSAAIPTRRFAVYRNNVVMGLVKALAKRFPATERIVGEEFFAAMARVYVAALPPRSPLLMTYGDEFADFIESFAPVAELPYLADVARLEAARTRAYHAADVAPLAAERFATLDPEALSRLRFTLHPSVQVVCSLHPIVTIWVMNAGERTLGEIEAWRGEDALIARSRLEVEVRALPAGGAAFLAALMRGAPLAAAAEEAAHDSSEFALAENLAGLIGSELVVGIEGEGKRP